jgi:hypothetical protein
MYSSGGGEWPRSAPLTAKEEKARGAQITAEKCTESSRASTKRQASESGSAVGNLSGDDRKRITTNSVIITGTAEHVLLGIKPRTNSASLSVPIALHLQW